MPEPQTSATATAVALLSPLAGPYAVIVFAALAGATWPLAAAQTSTRWEGAALLLRLVLTAAALTGFVAWLLESQLGWPASKLLAPVAFLIAAMGDRWRDPGALFAQAAAVIKQVRQALAGGGEQ